MRIIINFANHIPFRISLIFTGFTLLVFLSLCCSERKAPLAQRDYLSPDVMCGTVQFSDGCSPKLDTLIRFGIALIHHMTYEDAEYTFNKVIELDKDCFWGYWGKAMTLVHPLWPDIPDDKSLNEGFVLCQNALSLAKTKKEVLYGKAITAYFTDGVKKTEAERLTAFNNGWELASREMPQDIEAKMFHVLSMLSTVSPNDKSYKVQREAGAICEQVLKIIPDHPGAFHYAIHAYDYPPLAPEARRVAETYYKIAPELPHALHMPTHIFTRLGLWQESIDLNLRSADAAKKIPLHGEMSHAYFHALDYAVYAYLQLSMYKEANDVAILVDTLHGPFEPAPQTAYSLAAIGGRIALEYQDWKTAANLTLIHPDFPWKKFPQYEALVYFANGIGAGRSGNPAAALKAYQKLDELQKAFTYNASNKYWIDQIAIQKEVVKAWQLFAEGEKGKSLDTMIKAADMEDKTEKNPVTPGSLLPAREMLGDLYLELNRPKDALLQYEHSLNNCPNRFNSLYGAFKSAEMIGNKVKAKFYLQALKKIDKSTGPVRKHLEYAETFRIADNTALN